jgi:hypothetical protein
VSRKFGQTPEDRINFLESEVESYQAFLERYAEIGNAYAEHTLLVAVEAAARDADSGYAQCYVPKAKWTALRDALAALDAFRERGKT